MRRIFSVAVGALAALLLAGCAGSASGAVAVGEVSEASEVVEPTQMPSTPAPDAAVDEPAPEPKTPEPKTPEPKTPEPKTPEPTVAEPTVAEPTVAEPTRTPAPTPTAEPAPEPTVQPTPAPAPTSTSSPEPTATETGPTPTVTVTPAPEKEQLPPSGYTGEVRAIRTETGLVLAVRGENSGVYDVVTPCYEVAQVSRGLEITGPLDILIDPGHGGRETGAVGPNGLKESTVNLQVAELVRDQLLELGYSVELTRYADYRVAIQSRTALANALAPRVFISIHHNGGYPESLPEVGTEMFVQLGDPESVRLGGLLYEEIIAAFADIDADWMGNEETHGVATRANEEGTDLYGILRRTPDLVTVLTEAMFISTAAEADLLTRPEILQAEADALVAGLHRWFETDEPGSGYIEGIIFQGDLGNGGGTFGCVDPPLG